MRNLLMSKKNIVFFFFTGTCFVLICCLSSLLLNTSFRDRYVYFLSPAPPRFLELSRYIARCSDRVARPENPFEKTSRFHRRLTRFTCNTSGRARGRSANGRGVVTMC